MALENLFATEPALPNVQKTKMPDAPEKWAEVLTTQVRELFPDCSKLPITVEFKKKDDQAGTAIGAIHILSPELNKSVYVPFVIHRFELHPLDVWMEAKTQAVHPLTRDTFKEAFFNSNLSSGLDVRPTDSSGQYFNDPSMWTQTYPPLQGRYSYASAGYPILDQIADTMTAEDLTAFKAVLKAEPLLLNKFASNGHGDLIKKIAAKKTAAVETNDFAASARKLLPKSYLEIRKMGFNRYSVLASSDGVFDLASTEIHDREGCEKFLSNIIGKPQDALHEVDQNGEKFLMVRPAPKKGVFLYDQSEKVAEDASEFGCYLVKNENGLVLDAVVIPDIVDYSGKRVSGRLVLSKAHSCFQNKVAGIPNKDSACFEKVLKPSGIRPGQSGSFIYVGENGKAIATVPVTIKAIEKNDNQMLHVVDFNGRHFIVKLGWGNEFKTVEKDSSEKACCPPEVKEKETASLESLGFVEVKKDHFVIPRKMMWIPLEPMTEVSATPAKWMEKTAAENMTFDPVNVRFTGVVYEFSGGGLPKIEADEGAARGLLANLGADIEKTAQIMKKAKQCGKATVHGCEKLRSTKEVAENLKKAHEKVATACQNLRRSLVKEASEIDDSATVDMILSLGFMRPDNLAKFISYLPLFEAGADKLAELTLAARLGLKQVSESATAVAMSKLVEVVDGLKKIQASVKKPTTRAT